LKAIGIIPVLLCGLMSTSMLRAVGEEPDLELIEFLGSWEGEDDHWQEYFDSISTEPEQEVVDSDMNDGSKQHDVD